MKPANADLTTQTAFASSTHSTVTPLNYGFDQIQLLGTAAQSDPAKVGFSTILQHIGDFLIPAIGFAMLGWSASQYVTPQYGASADIMIHMQQPGDAVVRYQSSQSVIIKSNDFLSTIAVTTQVPIETLQDRLSVDFPKGGNVMRLSYEDPDPALAVRILSDVLATWQQSILPIEVEESVAHQVLSAPKVAAEPIFPKPLQFMAAGAAIGLIFSMIWTAFARRIGSAIQP